MLRMFRQKSLPLLIALGAAGTAWGLVSSVAHAASCDVGHSGYLDFRDRDSNPNQCGKVAGSNANWGALPGGWDNRADTFVNNGNTHNACVYDGYGGTGPRYHIPRGKTLIWRNKVSSNKWTTSGTCPTTPGS